MSKLLKLKRASKKSLACFLPSSMASSSSGTKSTLFGEPEARPTRPNGINQPKSKASETQPVRDVPGRPNGTNTRAMVTDNPKAESHLGTNSRAMVVDKDKPKADVNNNPVRDMVSYGTKEKEKDSAPKVEPEEEVEELKTPGFIRVFGCDNCANESTSDTEDTRNRPSCSHHSSSEDASDDDDDHHHRHQPPHLIPVVHLRVPMKNEDDVRKVVAALQIKGVLEVACDLENQIVKVTGTADPDRLLKKVKKVKRKSRLISYTNPREQLPAEDFSIPPFHGHNSFNTSSVPLRPPRHYYEPAEPGFHRPPPPPPPAAVYYDHHHHHHHHRPPPPTTSVRPPPAAAAFYDHELHYGRAPSSPPHYGSRGYYAERSHRSTSPPRRRSYQSFRPPPPPVVPGPPLHYGGRPWIPSAPYGMDDFHQVPHRSMHMYH